MIALRLIMSTVASHTATVSGYQEPHAIMAVIVIGLIAHHAQNVQAFYIVLALTFVGIAHAPIMARS